MGKKSILSQRLTKAQAALAEMSLNEVNAKAGFYQNYIYRLFGRDNIQLDTINKIAAAIGCKATDLMEEVDVEDVPDTQPKALAVLA